MTTTSTFSKTRSAQPTVTGIDDQLVYHHMPEGFSRPKLHGLTLRQAIRALRAVDFGGLGGVTPIDLSDGAYLEVTNKRATGGGFLIGVHEIRRMECGQVSATYPMQTATR